MGRVVDKKFMLVEFYLFALVGTYLINQNYVEFSLFVGSRFGSLSLGLISKI
jgi:hypothetical protein